MTIEPENVPTNFPFSVESKNIKIGKVSAGIAGKSEELILDDVFCVYNTKSDKSPEYDAQTTCEQLRESLTTIKENTYCKLAPNGDKCTISYTIITPTAEGPIETPINTGSGPCIADKKTKGQDGNLHTECTTAIIDDDGNCTCPEGYHTDKPLPEKEYRPTCEYAYNADTFGDLNPRCCSNQVYTHLLMCDDCNSLCSQKTHGCYPCLVTDVRTGKQTPPNVYVMKVNKGQDIKGVQLSPDNIRNRGWQASNL